ncbi:Proline-rich coiled-coil [Homalodisca vitripennis]|nr:Proline-rich coiled-coil [Homalodisca vitripennis]
MATASYAPRSYWSGSQPGSSPSHSNVRTPRPADSEMIRHNQPPGGFPPNYHPGPPRPRFPPSPDLRLMPPNKGVTNIEQEEITSRPIIKEEDLKVMDEISRDTGWAAHDEIDYK